LRPLRSPENRTSDWLAQGRAAAAEISALGGRPNDNKKITASWRFSVSTTLDKLGSIPGSNAKATVMDSSKYCRAQLAECQRLHPLAKSAAEATVLKNLIRSWKMIANQMALYEDIIANQE
jgi:hypothetical protein